MATSNSKYRFEEPQTGLYLAERADGTPGIAPRQDRALGFDTAQEAARYSSTRLHSTPHEIVRVDA